MQFTFQAAAKGNIHIHNDDKHAFTSVRDKLIWNIPRN